MTRSILHVLAALATLALSMTSSAPAHAGGFEVPENTTRAVSRGGTGAVLKRDPSALYFNPALLPRAEGTQILLDSNFVGLDVSFQRDPLTYSRGSRQVRRTFEETNNEAGLFPAPFLAMSTDLGLENFALGLGVFGPSAYGRLCYGELDDDGECVLRSYQEGALEGEEQRGTNAARHMMLESRLLQIYFTLGAGYTFEFDGGGELSFGLAGAAAYQDNTFRLVIDSDVFSPGQPWEERPSEEALFEARDLRDVKPTAFLGVAWTKGGAHIAASYRPPIRWEASGTANVELDPDLQETTGARLTDDEVILRTWQAGMLRVGFGWTDGVHPRFADRPRLELEANVTWEDWSRTQNFEVEVQGDLDLPELGTSIALDSIQQAKNWQDVYSLRLGAGWAFNRWVTGHAGAFMETPTQPVAYTSADFIAWERYGVGLGASVHATDWLDVELGYMYIGMPRREVPEGSIYQSIPLSECSPPDYDDGSCPTPGTPPGNPQNEGVWSGRFQIASVGLTLHFE